MSELIDNILGNYIECVAVLLFAIGFCLLLLDRNIVKKIIGMNIMDTALYLFLASMGYIDGRLSPIVQNGITSMETYVNPLPSGLVLTGIVVSVSVSALMLSLTVRLYGRYHTLNLDTIYLLAKYDAACDADDADHALTQVLSDKELLRIEREEGEN